MPENNLLSTLGSVVLTKLIKKLNLDDIDKLKLNNLDNLKSDKNSENTIVGKLNQDFYEKLLKKLSAPVTDENLKFLYAWRQSEGKAGKYNPLLRKDI